MNYYLLLSKKFDTHTLYSSYCIKHNFCFHWNESPLVKMDQSKEAFFSGGDSMRLTIRLLLRMLPFFLFSIPSDIRADGAWNGCVALPTLASDTDASFYQNRSGIPHGTLVDVTYNNYLGVSKPMRIYLPPNYDTSGLYYPVLYLSHGMGGSELDSTNMISVHYILDNLLAEGKAVPMIIAMPKWNGQYFGLSLGTEPAPLGNADVVTQELTKDIIPYIESHYRVKSDQWHRAIAGISLGGFAFLNTGLRRLDLFSEIFAYSPFSNDNHLALVEQNYKPILIDAYTNTLLALPLYISIGTGDTDWLVTASHGWDDLLTKYNIDHYNQWSNGGHVVMNFRRYIYQTLPVMFAPCTQDQSTMITLGLGGASRSSTPGIDNSTARSGYAKLVKNSGATPYGTAVFKYKENDITVSEAGVPASPPTTYARVFIDYRPGVSGVPGRSDSGTVDVNTGIGIINYGLNTANIIYTLRNTDGKVIANGQGTLVAGMHLATFINQLKDVATGFVLPSNFGFASLDIVSDQPLSVTALRMTINQRGEHLFTTTPVADGNQRLAYDPIYFPQLADGGGWTTSFILMNTSGFSENGSLEFFDNSGRPLVVHPVGGGTVSSITYSIPALGIFRIRTDGSFTDAKVGWARLKPADANPTPVGSGVFSYNPGNVMTTESGIPSVVSTTHARVFVDLTENHNTGLAIANLDTTTAGIEIQAFQADGVTSVGKSQGPLQLAGFGHDAKFANQIISGLPDHFMGVLDISASTPFAALTTRSLINERKDFLITTFPVADATQTAPSPIVFPHIVDGGGYVTQFILLSPEGAANASLILYDDKAKPFGKAQ
jgi:enterochelin esterase-like enzyme